MYAVVRLIAKGTFIVVCKGSWGEMTKAQNRLYCNSIDYYCVAVTNKEIGEVITIGSEE